MTKERRLSTSRVNAISVLVAYRIENSILSSSLGVLAWLWQKASLNSIAAVFSSSIYVTVALGLELGNTSSFYFLAPIPALLRPNLSLFWPGALKKKIPGSGLQLGDSRVYSPCWTASDDIEKVVAIELLCLSFQPETLPSLLVYLRHSLLLKDNFATFKTAADSIKNCGYALSSSRFANKKKNRRITKLQSLTTTYLTDWPEELLLLTEGSRPLAIDKKDAVCFISNQHKKNEILQFGTRWSIKPA